MPSLISSSPFSSDLNYFSLDNHHLASCSSSSSSSSPPSPTYTEENDAFDPRDLEATFCRDFSCCGLTLNDLHDLLQHYEEEHVRFEEDQGASFVDLYSPLSPPPPPPPPPSASSNTTSSSSSPSLSPDPFPFFAADPWPPVSTTVNVTTTSVAATRVVAKPLLKINPGVYPASSIPSPVTPSCAKPSLSDVYSEEVSLHAEKNSKNVSAFNNSVLRAHDSSAVPTLSSHNSKKRSFETSGISSAAPLQQRQLPTPISTKLTFYSSDNAPLPTPPVTPVAPQHPPSPNAQENFTSIDKSSLLPIAASSCGPLNNDSSPTKAFRCPISSCQRTYKNANGLKYHTSHSHSEPSPLTNVTAIPSSASVPSVSCSVQKPYRCKVGECGKRYKNLNGLKYHIEHCHVLSVVRNTGSDSA